jgi:hypothetical protein
MVLRTLHWMGLTDLTTSQVDSYEKSIKPGRGMIAVLVSAIAALAFVTVVVVAGIFGNTKGLQSMSFVQVKLPLLADQAKVLAASVDTPRGEIERSPVQTSEQVRQRLATLSQEINDLGTKLKAVGGSNGGLFPGTSRLRATEELKQRTTAVEHELAAIDATVPH